MAENKQITTNNMYSSGPQCNAYGKGRIIHLTCGMKQINRYIIYSYNILNKQINPLKLTGKQDATLTSNMAKKRHNS